MLTSMFWAGGGLSVASERWWVVGASRRGSLTVQCSGSSRAAVPSSEARLVGGGHLAEQKEVRVLHGELHHRVRAYPPPLDLVFAEIKEDVRVKIHALAELGVLRERSGQSLLGGGRQRETQREDGRRGGGHRQRRQRSEAGWRSAAHHVRHGLVHRSLPVVPVGGAVVVHHAHPSGRVHDQDVLVVPAVLRVPVEQVGAPHLPISGALWEGVQGHH
eukprot:6505453-Pyramimonas_sp.AAC.1